MPSSSSSSSVPVEITGLPTEIITGYTIPDSDSEIGPIITVNVVPPELASEINHEFDGEERAQIADWSYDTDSGDITFKVKGCSPATPPDQPEGDTMLNLLYEGEVITFAPVIVVIPAAIGSSHPHPDTDVTRQNLVMDKDSTPPHWKVGDNEVFLGTVWLQSLAVPVVDQFNNPLSELYDGQPVEEDKEGWHKINQNVSGGSYTDLVGLLWARQGQALFPVTVPPNTVVTGWPTATPPNLPPIPSSSTEDIPVRIGGHELNPAVTNRTWIHTLPNHIQIIWP